MPRISQLPSLTVPDSGDELAIVDTSAATTKKISRTDFLKGAPLPPDTVTASALASSVWSVTTNSNGTSIRYGNGIQICFHTLAMGPGNAAGAGTLANMYRTANQGWTFPQAFDDASKVAISGTGHITGGSSVGAGNFEMVSCTNVSTTEASNVQVFRGSNDSGNITARMMAIGTWS